MLPDPQVNLQTIKMGTPNPFDPVTLSGANGSCRIYSFPVSGFLSAAVVTSPV